MNNLNILVVEDDPANLEGMCNYLGRNGFTVHGANDARQALEICENFIPDVAVLDIVLPLTPNVQADINIGVGIGLGEQIRQSHPHAGLIFRSAYTHFAPEVLALVRQGQGGIAYLFKGGGKPSRLLDAIHTTSNGGIYVDPRISAAGQSTADAVLETFSPEERAIVLQIMPWLNDLTARELDVIQRLSWSRRAIAEHLVISERTVDRHVNNIYSKLGLTKSDEPDLRQDVILAKAYLVYQLRGKS